MIIAIIYNSCLYEEFMRLAGTRLARISFSYLEIALDSLDYKCGLGWLSSE